MIRRTLYTGLLIAAFLMALAPSSAVFGFDGGGCGCVLGPYECGLDGYTCYCCLKMSEDLDSPSIQKCRMGARFFSLAHPPALPIVKAAPEESFMLLYEVAPLKESFSQIYPFLSTKPPSSIS